MLIILFEKLPKVSTDFIFRSLFHLSFRWSKGRIRAKASEATEHAQQKTFPSGAAARRPWIARDVTEGASFAKRGKIRALNGRRISSFSGSSRGF